MGAMVVFNMSLFVAYMPKPNDPPRRGDDSGDDSGDNSGDNSGDRYHNGRSKTGGRAAPHERGTADGQRGNWVERSEIPIIPINN